MKVMVIKTNLSPDEYLNKIETYLRNIIMNLQNSDIWKIHITIAINFTSSHSEEEHECIKVVIL